MSIARDKTLRLHHSSGGAVLASHDLPGVPMSLQYDAENLSIFVGDTKGKIYVLRLEGRDIKHLSVLEGHSGVLVRCGDPSHLVAAVSCMHWESKLGVLMSGRSFFKD